MNRSFAIALGLWWALLGGGPVALATALAHVPEVLRPEERTSRLATIFLLMFLVTASGLAFWGQAFSADGFAEMVGLPPRWTTRFVLTGLCQGYVFAVCYGLGASCRPRQGIQSPPDPPGSPAPTARA